MRLAYKKVSVFHKTILFWPVHTVADDGHICTKNRNQISMIFEECHLFCFTSVSITYIKTSSTI